MTTYCYATVDELGRSPEIAQPRRLGGYGARLHPGDPVKLVDGSRWTVEEVHGYIQSGPSGSGQSNYIAVLLAAVE